MTDANTIEHDADEPRVEQPRVIPPEPPVNQEVAREIREARALIPVGATGAAPINFAQQVDFAKTMAQARSALPTHLQGSAGDCLAILDISSRAGLSPYMVANQTYVGPDGRLAFMSQLFHALVVQSGRLKGDLKVKYNGEGEDRTCTVWGTLKGETEPHEHTSPPLKQVRPAANDKGRTKGSPLWQKKPDVQLFYDTSRDWVRMFCPTATLGIYTPEEMEETPIGPDNARDVTGLTERLANNDKTEGHRDGHVDSELAQIAPDGTKKIIDGEFADPGVDKTPAKAAGSPAKRERKPKPPTAEQQKKVAQAAADRAQSTVKPSLTDKQVQKAADAAEARSQRPEQDANAANQPATPPQEPATQPDPPRAKPKNVAEYLAWANEWINETTTKEARAERWKSERGMRNFCGITSDERAPLEAKIAEMDAEEAQK